MHCVPSLTRVLRLQDNLLVIGATNEPENIAPKILTGRFERKVFVDNPNSSARRAMLTRQLSEEDHAHMLSAADIEFVVEATAGRSGVNMERLISSACTTAAGMPVSRDEFETALEAERVAASPKIPLPPPLNVFTCFHALVQQLALRWPPLSLLEPVLHSLPYLLVSLLACTS